LLLDGHSWGLLRGLGGFASAIAALAFCIGERFIAERGLPLGLFGARFLDLARSFNLVLSFSMARSFFYPLTSSASRATVSSPQHARFCLQNACHALTATRSNSPSTKLATAQLRLQHVAA